MGDLNKWLIAGDHVTTSLAFIQWALCIWPRAVMPSAFGMAGGVLIDILRSAGYTDVKILFLDTGYHFDETLETKAAIEARYGFEATVYRPKRTDGRRCCLPTPREPDQCCEARKVQPFDAAIADLAPDVILTSRARFQSPTRSNLMLVESGSEPPRINPLALWTQTQIAAYVAGREIPYNPLYDRGYPSIGCRPCTAPAAEGAGIRSGRWAGRNKMECGMWTQ